MRGKSENRFSYACRPPASEWINQGFGAQRCVSIEGIGASPLPKPRALKVSAALGLQDPDLRHPEAGNCRGP